MSGMNKLLLLIFSLLLILVLWLENPFAETDYSKSEQAIAPLFPHFNFEKANKIEISRGKDQILLEKDSSGKWILPAVFNYRAQEGRVNTLLRTISRFKNTALLEESASNFDEIYGVGEKGTTIKVTDASGAVMANFIRGEIPVDWTDRDKERKLAKFAAYLRKVDEKKIYQVEEFTPVVMNSKDWLDAELVHFDSAKAQELELEGKLVDGAIALKREGEEWKLVKPEAAPAKKEVVNAMARSFAAVYFKELVGPAKDLANYGLDQPQLKVHVKLEGGEERQLLIGKQLDDKSYYARRDEKDPFVYQVQAYAIDALKKTVADLKYVPPAPPETPKVEEKKPEEKPKSD